MPGLETAEQLIDRIPEEDLRSLMLELCREDERLFSRITSRYSGKVNTAYLRKLHQEMKRICDRCSDRGNFIDWRNVNGFEAEVTDFLTDQTAALVDRGEPAAAFQVVNDALRCIDGYAIDDSGQLCFIASIVDECWSMILAAASPIEKDRMFVWFTDHMDGEGLPFFIEDTISDFYEREFQEPRFLKKKIGYYSVPDPIPTRDNYHAYYVYQNKVKQLLILMEKTSCTDEEIRERIRHFYILPETRKFAVEYALKQGKTDEAIAILQESRTLDKEYRGLVSDHSNRLIELYDAAGREDECREELLFQIFECRQDDLDNIGKLKSKCSRAEWEEYRERLLMSASCYGIRYQLLAAEDMDERLLEMIEGSGSVYALDEYEKRLKQKYPEKVRDIYAAYVKKSMREASSRSQYAGVIRYLKKIRHYPDGRSLSGQIAEEFRAAFPRRRAMLEELTKAGF